MNIRIYNIKNQNTEVCQYLAGALEAFSADVCLQNTTFYTRLSEVVAKKASYTLSQSNFDGLRAKYGVEALSFDFFSHVAEKLSQVKVDGNINGWLNAAAHNFFIDLSKKESKWTPCEDFSYLADEADVMEEYMSFLCDYLNSLESDKKYSKDLKRRLLLGEAFADLSAEFGIPVSILKKVKARLKAHAQQWAEKMGY